VRHVVQCCFNGSASVIFSGGEAKGTDELWQEIRGLRDGGAFGSIWPQRLPAADDEGSSCCAT